MLGGEAGYDNITLAVLSRLFAQLLVFQYRPLTRWPWSRFVNKAILKSPQEVVGAHPESAIAVSSTHAHSSVNLWRRTLYAPPLLQLDHSSCIQSHLFRDLLIVLLADQLQA